MGKNSVEIDVEVSDRVTHVAVLECEDADERCITISVACKLPSPITIADIAELEDQVRRSREEWCERASIVNIIPMEKKKQLWHTSGRPKKETDICLVQLEGDSHPLHAAVYSGNKRAWMYESSSMDCNAVVIFRKVVKWAYLRDIEEIK